MNAFADPKRSKMQAVLASHGSLPTRADGERFLQSLTASQRLQLANDWDMWAMPHQRLPPGKWRQWILRGGRGSGKSAAAHNTLHKIARDPKLRGRGTLAIIGRTHSDVRTNNILDPESGIMATAPIGFKPTFQDQKGILTWPNGAICYVLSGDAPGSIRGKNLSFAICDEMPEWPDSERTWFEVLQPAVRKGFARVMVCMTPKPLAWLRELEKDEDTVVTGATTFDNPFLAGDALKAFLRAYANKPEASRQELYGEYIDKVQGALIEFRHINDNRTLAFPKLRRIIVAVDPATTNNSDSDETGIIVYGEGEDGQGYVLADESGKFEIRTGEWARKICDLRSKWKANVVIAEVNNGGDLVEATLRAVDPSIPYESVRASKGKETRAEPVATLYELGKIHHVGTHDKFRLLETEWYSWIPGSRKSPNRLDAVVWAATHAHLSDKAATKKSSDGLFAAFGG